MNRVQKVSSAKVNSTKRGKTTRKSASTKAMKRTSDPTNGSVKTCYDELLYIHIRSTLEAVGLVANSIEKRKGVTKSHLEILSDLSDTLRERLSDVDLLLGECDQPDEVLQMAREKVGANIEDIEEYLHETATSMDISREALCG